MVFALVIGAASALGVVAFYRLDRSRVCAARHADRRAPRSHRRRVLSSARHRARAVDRVGDRALGEQSRWTDRARRAARRREARWRRALPPGGRAHARRGRHARGRRLRRQRGTDRGARLRHWLGVRARAAISAAPTEDPRRLRRGGRNLRGIQRALRRRLLRARRGARLILDRRVQPRRDRERRRRDHRATVSRIAPGVSHSAVRRHPSARDRAALPAAGRRVAGSRPRSTRGCSSRSPMYSSA